MAQNRHIKRNNTMFVNAFEIPEDNHSIIHFPGNPRQYRSDCKAGIFKIGESEIIGNSIEMEIISFRDFDDAIFNYPYQKWLEIFFIDKDNVVSHLLFKTESIDNFLELLRKLMIAKKAIRKSIVTAKMSKRSNDNGTYYAVEFESADNKPDRVKELTEFVNNNINGIYDAKLAHTFKNSQQAKQLPSVNNQEKVINNSQELEDF